MVLQLSVINPQLLITGKRNIRPIWPCGMTSIGISGKLTNSSGFEKIFTLFVSMTKLIILLKEGSDIKSQIAY